MRSVYCGYPAIEQPHQKSLFMLPDRKSQSGDFLNNYSSVDGQQDNSDSNESDFYLKLFTVAAHTGAMNVAKFKFTLVLFRPFHMVLRFKGPPSIFMEQTQEVWFSRLQQKCHCWVDNCPGSNVLNISPAWSWHSVEGYWSFTASHRPHFGGAGIRD